MSLVWKTEKPITRKDIAELCGVSVSVVSRALNNSGYVEDGKRKRIIETAEKLGYVPQPVAMSLQERRTKQILFYCKDLNNEYNMEMYRGMCQAANERGYMVVMNGVMKFERIKDTMIDGIIMPNENITEYYMKEKGKNYYLPVVSASYSNPVVLPKSVPLIEVDMYRVTEMGINYLLKMGHEKIALGFPYELDNLNSRLISFKEHMQVKVGSKNFVVSSCAVNSRTNTAFSDSGELRAEHEYEVEEDFFEKGRAAARVFMKRQMNATAVLCFNDEFALGMMKEFGKAGVRIPDDVSVMGIDGTRTRRYVTPLLTTVNTYPQRHGCECVNILIDMIEKKNKRYVVHIAAGILEGESVKNLAAGHKRRGGYV